VGKKDLRGAENAGPEMQDLKIKDQTYGHENAGPYNGGPSGNAASICCVDVAKWEVTSSTGTGVILS